MLTELTPRTQTWGVSFHVLFDLSKGFEDQVEGVPKLDVFSLCLGNQLANRLQDRDQFLVVNPPIRVPHPHQLVTVEFEPFSSQSRHRAFDCCAVVEDTLEAIHLGAPSSIHGLWEKHG